MALADANTQVRMACERLEQLNVVGFEQRDVLNMPILRGLPNNPCVAMGITQPKSGLVTAKPTTQLLQEQALRPSNCRGRAL